MANLPQTCIKTVKHIYATIMILLYICYHPTGLSAFPASALVPCSGAGSACPCCPACHCESAGLQGHSAWPGYPARGEKSHGSEGAGWSHPLHPAQPEDFTGVCREQGVHLCIGGGTLRADGSSGILAQAREDVPTAAWGRRGTSFSPSPLGPCRGFLL